MSIPIQCSAYTVLHDFVVCVFHSFVETFLFTFHGLISLFTMITMGGQPHNGKFSYRFSNQWQLWHESDIRRKKSIHFSIQYKYVISICCNCFPSHFHINLISGFSFYSNSDSTFILNNFTLLFDSLFNKNIATLFINMKCKKLWKIFHSRMCLCRFYSRQ